jgi:hypothetical protein
MSKSGGLLVVLMIASASAIAATSNLPFIDDDYAKALATAKQRNSPMFVEVSAPW